MCFFPADCRAKSRNGVCWSISSGERWSILRWRSRGNWNVWMSSVAGAVRTSSRFSIHLDRCGLDEDVSETGCFLYNQTSFILYRLLSVRKRSTLLKKYTSPSTKISICTGNLRKILTFFVCLQAKPWKCYRCGFQTLGAEKEAHLDVCKEVVILRVLLFSSDNSNFVQNGAKLIKFWIFPPPPPPWKFVRSSTQNSGIFEMGEFLTCRVFPRPSVWSIWRAKSSESSARTKINQVGTGSGGRWRRSNRVLFGLAAAGFELPAEIRQKVC